MKENDKLSVLKHVIDRGKYVVALCGSGMLRECGGHSLKEQNTAYEIEEKYGRSPEYLYTDVYFNTRTEAFFDFYKNEILIHLDRVIR